MSARKIARSSALVAGGALALVLAAACQSQTGASGSGGPSTGAAAAPTGASTPASVSGDGGGAATAGNGGSASGSGSGKGASGGGKGAGAKSDECKAGELKLTEGQGNGAGAGSTYPAVQFTNTGSRTCVMQGFPGVSYVTGDSGQQVGGAASRSGSIGAEVRLKPGAMASAVVQMAQTGNFDAGTCKPVDVRGLRIYPPDDTASMFLPFTGSTVTACSSTAIPNGTQLSVQTVQAGDGTS